MPRSPIIAGALLSLCASAPTHSRPSIELGSADGLALDQPKVAVEFFDASDQPLGPISNVFLLDTAAERIIVFGKAVTELEANGYQTDAVLLEQGIGGFIPFDVSLPYRVDFAGTSGPPITLEGVRALSDESNTTFDLLGPNGIIGMPGLAGRVASFDFSPFGEELFGAMNVTFAGALPAGNGHRYTIPLELIDFPLDEPDPPTTATGIPFLTAIIHGPERKRRGRFAFDTGAQASILSEHLAFALGLDTDDDGNFDNEAVDTVPITGVGGTINAPVLNIGSVAIPTAEGTDLVLLNVQAIILEIHPKIDGIFASDWLTSGWFEVILGDEDDGYFQAVHCDFLAADQHRGTLALDITPALDTPAPGLPPVDLDGDHIADDWECLFFDNLDMPATGDGDLDTLSLLLEHALNTDPTKPDPSPLKITRNPDGTITLRFPRNRELPFIELIVEHSPSLAPGSWAQVIPTATSSVLFDALTEHLSLTFAPNPGYYRLHAKPLPGG